MKYINWIISACALVALIMIFLPTIKADSEKWNGIKCSFGYSESFMGVSVKVFKFSILNLLPWVLVIVYGVIAGMNKSNNKVMTIATIAIAVVAAVLFFMSKNFININGLSGEELKESRKLFDLGIGAILAGIFSLIAAAGSVLKLVFEKE